uniref:Cytochrome c oxidase subunit IV n=1 Tax=Thermostichus vulcanus TaxID=32053 RepID=Q56179_THEVL|nr:cytochrome c oxidase subunit IV [Thermostichus vulcanus]
MNPSPRERSILVNFFHNGHRKNHQHHRRQTKVKVGNPPLVIAAKDPRLKG